MTSLQTAMGGEAKSVVGRLADRIVRMFGGRVVGEERRDGNGDRGDEG